MSSAVNNYASSYSQIPKGPTCIVLWAKEDTSPETQEEVLEDAVNLLTSNFDCPQQEKLEPVKGRFAVYLKLELRLSNKCIYRHLEKLR